MDSFGFTGYIEGRGACPSGCGSERELKKGPGMPQKDSLSSQNIGNICETSSIHGIFWSDAYFLKKKQYEKNRVIGN
jgi:hypothetical protein